LNIASTVLQLDWYFEVEELNISPITKPEKAHEFLRRWPGLYDFVREHSEILSLYVPQLTIRGFDEGFEEEFDDLLEQKMNVQISFFLTAILKQYMVKNQPAEML
jgi:hypothetical protein